MIATDAVAGAFARAKAEGRPALIAFVVAGDPSPGATESILLALGDAGVDIIELGIPYGDPLADGPSIQAAAQRALAHGVGIDQTFGIVSRAAAAGAPPILLFTYVNPVVQYGVARFAEGAASAGAAGAIVPDVPMEESATIGDALAAHGLVMPLLVAPRTPLERAATIARASSGFVYIVARLGVTGAAKSPDFDWIAARLDAIRQLTTLPLAVGFGISSAEHVRRIGAIADGAIVGSALIDAVAANPTHAAQTAADFTRALHATS